jgi:hypothetical protein
MVGEYDGRPLERDVLEISLTDRIFDIHLAENSVEYVAFGTGQSVRIDAVKPTDREEWARPGNLLPKLGERRWGVLSHGAAEHDAAILPAIPCRAMTPV